MLNHRLPITLVILLAAGGAGRVHAGTTVTIANHSGKDLFLARAGGKTESPIFVTAKSDEAPGRSHPFCLRPRSADPVARAGEAELFRPDPTAGPCCTSVQRHYLLRSGEAATLSFEEQGKDLEAELVLYHLDAEAGISFNGIVLFSLSHQPGPPDGVPEPEARLTLPGGPGPRQRMACNRNLTLVSPTELKVLPASSRSVAEGEKKVPDLRL